MSHRDCENSISIVIPSYNTPREHLQCLYLSLLRQSLRSFNVIIVDDCSDFNHYDIIKDERFKIVYKKINSGPADCRNIGAELIETQNMFFTDADCELAVDTLKTVVENIGQEDLIVGNTITKTMSLFGSIVALLGFPGGGSIGFDKVWRVDKDGYTESLSSCNFAIKKKVFFDIGKFNDGFRVAGGEDTVFAKKAIDKKYRIKYLPKQIVYHVEMDSWKGFMNWQIVRGRGNYYIKKALTTVSGFFKLRVWSFKNSLKRAGLFYAPFVFLLILLSVYYQTKGYKMEKSRNRVT